MREKLSNKISEITKKACNKFFILLGSILLANIMMAFFFVLLSHMIFGGMTSVSWFVIGTFLGLAIGMIMNEKTFLKLQHCILTIKYMHVCRSYLKCHDSYEDLIKLNTDLMDVEKDFKD